MKNGKQKRVGVGHEYWSCWWFSMSLETLRSQCFLSFDFVLNRAIWRRGYFRTLITFSTCDIEAAFSRRLKECQGSEQNPGSTSLSCGCNGEHRDSCSEMCFGVF